jgi:hypothetical protein
MNETTSISHHRPIGGRRKLYRQIALVALLVLMIGGVGLAIETRNHLAEAAPANETAAEPLPTFPARALPAEWRWHGQPQVQFERMYRKDTTPRLDWIR